MISLASETSRCTALLIVDAGTMLSSRTNFAGAYAHSSLRPASTYVARPGLERKLQEQFPMDTDFQTVRKMRTAVVWGLGGSGKSQLVLNFVQEQRERYQGIFWIEAGKRETIQRDYIQIYKQIYDTAGKDNANLSVDDAVTGVKGWLQRQERRSLWVMDSADDIDDPESEPFIDLNYYLPEAPQLDRIVTTRSSRVEDMATQDAIAVGVMDPSEAVRLLQKSARIEQSDRETKHELDAIVKELGYLALAIALAGSYIRERPGLSSDLSSYRAEYKMNRARLLSQRASPLIHRYGESVLSTWEVSIGAIIQRSPIAANLLCLLAFLNPDDIFLSLFMSQPVSKNYGEVINASQTKRLRDRFSRLFTRDREPVVSVQNRWLNLLSPSETTVDYNEILSAFKVLRAYSLVSWHADQQAFSMHKLVHAWSCDRLEETQQQTWSLAALELLYEVSHQHQNDLETQLRLVPHVVANYMAISSARSLLRLAQDRDKKNLGHMGDLLKRLGRWDDEYRVRILLFELYEKLLGRKHPKTLDSMNKLAETLRSQGKFKQAEAMHRMTLQLREEVLGKDDLDTFASVNNLAIALRYQGKYEEAEKILREMLVAKERVLGPNNHEVLVSTNNLGLILEKQGKYKEAEKLHRQTLGRYKQTLGDEHPHTLDSMNNLAVALRQQGKYDQAETLLRRTIELREKVLGPEHPSTLGALNNLAMVIEKQGKFDEAAAMQCERLRISERILGREHPDTLTSMNNLAVVLIRQGKHGQAEEMYKEFIRIGDNVLGPEHPKIVKALGSLVRCLKKQGKWDEADKIAELRENRAANSTRGKLSTG